MTLDSMLLSKHRLRLEVWYNLKAHTKLIQNKTLQYKQAMVVRKHNKPCPRVVRFLGIDQKCNQVIPWSLHTFPENFMQISLAVCS